MEPTFRDCRMPEPLNPDWEKSYEEIAAALSQTARGRAFLAEHARRSRSAETRRVLDAVARLERRLAPRRREQHLAEVRRALDEIGAAIRRARAETGELMKTLVPATGPVEAPGALAVLMGRSKQSRPYVLETAEQIQEIAWKMREAGFDAGLCDTLDGRASELYGVCALHDLTTDGVERLLEALVFIEARVGSLRRVLGHADLGAASQVEAAASDAS